MNEIIQGLECNATNGKENFCYINENKLNAMKELAKREYKENKQLKKNWNELKKWIRDYLKLFDNPDYFEEQSIEDLNEVLDKIKELEEGVKE